MPKSILVDPADVRKPSTLKIADIPVNSYKSDFKKELKTFGAGKLKQIWLDMVYIREFETMLNTFKTMGAWNGIEYNHKGPAHLSIGQEAASVGQCAALLPDDFIFGSHRSHGEILAKCLSASRLLPEHELVSVMEQFLDNETLKLVEYVHDIADKAMKQVKLGQILKERATVIQQSTEKTHLQLQAQSELSEGLVHDAETLLETVRVFKLPA